MKNGLIFGVILVLGLANGAIGLPLALGFLLLTSHHLYWTREDGTLRVILLLKLTWMTAIFLSRAAPTPFSFILLLAFDVALFVTMIVRRPVSFVAGLRLPLLILFLVDVSFNCWSYVFGVDPFGRPASLRPGDFLPRLGGVFYHPFYSINISMVAMLLCLAGWRDRTCRCIFFIAMANVLANGSLRGLVLIMVFFGMCFLLKRGMGFLVIFIMGLLMAAGVFYSTVLSTDYLPPGSGNHYRVFAWANALRMIQEHPLTGSGSFQTGELPVVSEETIHDFGIAESQYLDYGIRYGVVPAIAHFLLLAIILRRSVKTFYQHRNGPASHIALASAIFSAVAFVDSFYGTFLGAMLTSISFGIFQFTCRPDIPHFRAERGRVSGQRRACIPSNTVRKQGLAASSFSH